MVRIDRPAVGADVRTMAAQFDIPLRAVVAGFAQALKRPEPELIHVAPMRLNMIADRRRLDDAAFQAERTQWDVRAADAFGCEPSAPWSTTYPTSSVGRKRP